jgi:hypothetical protein
MTMKKFKVGIIVMLFVVCGRGLFGENSFQKVEQWKFDTEPFGRRFVTIIDSDHHLIGGFFKSPMRVISPKTIVKFGHYGKGPSDLTDAQAIFLYKGDLAVVERPDKVKVFSKKDGNYKWKETKWFKRGSGPNKIRDVVFFKNKFFFAGYEAIAKDMKFGESAYLKVYDQDGNILKRLIRRKGNDGKRLWEMRYYVEAYADDTILFLSESELKVTVVSAKKVEVLKEVTLEIPSFYKKIPENFYAFSPKNRSIDLKLELEKWALGYSAITETAVHNGKLILQVRTCSEKLKKFALLVYNIKDWKLEQTIFIDDFFLGARDGKFYFFAHGNPGRDENTDNSIINIYSFDKVSNKLSAK